MPQPNDEIDLDAASLANSDYAGHPGYTNKTVEKKNDNEAGKSRDQKEADRQATENRIRKQTDEALRTKNRLYENQNVNLGKNNPQGNLNNRSFGKTLALSRAADKYNNKPVGLITTVRGGSAVDGLQMSQMKPYERPAISTEETRQMEKNRRIDEARQMMRAGLQGKVDQWTYDRLSSMFEQLAALNVSDDQYRNMLNQYMTQSIVQQALTKDMAWYNNQLRRWGINMDAKLLLDLSQNSSIASGMIAMLFGLPTTVSREQLYTERYMYQMADDIQKVTGMSTAESMAAVQKILAQSSLNEAEKAVKGGK